GVASVTALTLARRARPFQATATGRCCTACHGWSYRAGVLRWFALAYRTRNRAPDLRRRLNHHGVDLESLAREAATLFEVAGRPVAARWLTLELQGYGSAVDRAPLHKVLGVEEGDRLVMHVSAYRTQ